ncbi:MAG TPA: hypothetical protein ENK06_08280 [Gammaproteobacteria bacterium]|nr:hypothetical protein [Gammaproteobacteria bacterium]
MSEQTDDLIDAAKTAVEGDDIREQIKQITLAALTQRKFDKENIKQVVNSVVQGVSEGVGDSAERMKPQISEAMSGIDDALGKTAMATKLAAEEAAATIETFTKQDLKKMAEQLDSLEDLFIDSISSVATQSSELTSKVLSELAGHLKDSGTQVGKEALAAVKSLKDVVFDTGKESVDEIATATQTAGKQVREVVSGVLSGVAEAIQPKKKD